MSSTSTAMRVARFAFIAASSWLALPVLAADNPVAHCKDLGGDMEQGFTTQCTLPQASLEQAYAYLRGSDEDGKHYLAASMPRQDLKRDDEKDNVSIAYHWAGAGHLDIQMDFGGGTTKYRLVQQGPGVVLTTMRFPD